MALKYKNRTIGVLGLTGEIEKVKIVALVMKKMVETMIEFESHKEKTLKRKTEKERFINSLFYEDRIVPIIESVVNIIFSIVFLKIFGLAGVFMGTICSNLITHIYTYPKFIYVRLFKQKYSQYFKDTGKYFIITLGIAVITYILSGFIAIDNDLLQVILRVLLVIIVPNLFTILMFHKTKEYRYFYELIVGQIKNKLIKA